MDIPKLKETLEVFKKDIMDKFESVEQSGSAKANEMEKKLDDHIAKQLELQKQRSISMPGVEAEKKTFNIHKVFKACLNNGKFDEDAGYEHEICSQLATKSANGGSGAAGGYLIPDEVSSEVIDLAMDRTAVMELGPTVMRGLRGELPIPKVTGRPTMYWVGEEEEPTESGVSFGQIKLAPKNAAAFTKISQRLLYQSAGVAERIVREQLVNSFTIGIETALINGTGSNGQPKGVTKYDGLTTSTTLLVQHSASGRFRVDDAQRMQKDIDLVNMLKGNLGYLMRPEVLSGMMRERVVEYSAAPASTGAPVINPFMTRGIIEQALYGAKVRTTSLVGIGNTASAVATDSNVIFGDWSQLIAAFWEGFEIKASDTAGNAGGSALTQGQVWMVARQGIDINVKDQTGFTMITDCDTAEANW